MKITIDTKEDSHDEIRKVIKLLQTMVENAHNPDIFASSSSISNSEPIQSSEPTPSMFGMFGDNPSKETPPTTDTTENISPEPTEEIEESTDTAPEVQLY